MGRPGQHVARVEQEKAASDDMDRIEADMATAGFPVVPPPDPAAIEAEAAAINAMCEPQRQAERLECGVVDAEAVEETMTVTVRDRSAEAPWGSPGLLRVAVRRATISAYCPTCGGRRGEAQGLNSCDDGAYYWVQIWENSCGHRDNYPDVIQEARERGTLGQVTLL